MAEDFLGLSGKLEESFVGAANSKLVEVAFEAFEDRAAKEKPQLAAGLRALKEIMGTEEFSSLINNLQNVNMDGKSLLMVAGDEKIRTALISKWLPAIKQAFGVENVRIVGGGRNGIDAY